MIYHWWSSAAFTLRAIFLQVPSLLFSPVSLKIYCRNYNYMDRRVINSFLPSYQRRCGDVLRGWCVVRIWVCGFAASLQLATWVPVLPLHGTGTCPVTVFPYIPAFNRHTMLAISNTVLTTELKIVFHLNDLTFSSPDYNIQNGLWNLLLLLKIRVTDENHTHGASGEIMQSCAHIQRVCAIGGRHKFQLY